MHAAMKRLALALAPFRVNAVAPGPTLPLPGPTGPPSGRRAGHAAAGARSIRPRWPTRCNWLLDARRVTAQTIFVDAGQHLRQWKEPAA